MKVIIERVFDGLQSTLDSIPADASVLAAGGYTPGLRKHQELYGIFYHNNKAPDPKLTMSLCLEKCKMKNMATLETATLKLYKEAGYQESSLSSKDVLVLEKK